MGKGYHFWGHLEIRLKTCAVDTPPDIGQLSFGELLFDLDV